MKDPAIIASHWLKVFSYSPTKGQVELIHKISAFLTSRNKHEAFQLKGYAGTGKTSIISSLVRILPEFNINFVLLAPTGRAAKVISNYSGNKAFTIHKKLYQIRTNKEGHVGLILMPNTHKNTLFIVDEASMIPDQSMPGDSSLFSSQRILDDLVYYVCQGENCKLLLIGDSAQLPPVGLQLSPALDKDYLEKSYRLQVFSHELKEVVRQARESGILLNATAIREKINNKDISLPVFSQINNQDIYRIGGYELEDELNSAYSKYGPEGCNIICRSNKRANIFNQEIRNRILFKEDEIAAGDLLMVVRNNYYWLEKDSRAGFVANGDIVEIQRISRVEEMHGFHFAEVSLKMLDYPEEPTFDAKILLDTIMAETPALPWKEQKKLGEEIMKDYQDIPLRRKRYEKLLMNPYYNALQVKFAYALTCHKAQGGQWDIIFLDQGYITDEMMDVDYFRWLYTGITRATKKLYLVNFNERFFRE